MFFVLFELFISLVRLMLAPASFSPQFYLLTLLLPLNFSNSPPVLISRVCCLSFLCRKTFIFHKRHINRNILHAAHSVSHFFLFCSLSGLLFSAPSYFWGSLHQICDPAVDFKRPIDLEITPWINDVMLKNLCLLSGHRASSYHYADRNTSESSTYSSGACGDSRYKAAVWRRKRRGKDPWQAATHLGTFL